MIYSEKTAKEPEQDLDRCQLIIDAKKEVFTDIEKMDLFYGDDTDFKLKNWEQYKGIKKKHLGGKQ